MVMAELEAARQRQIMLAKIQKEKEEHERRIKLMETQKEDLLKESGAMHATFKEYVDWFEAHIKKGNDTFQYCSVDYGPCGAYIIRNPVNVPQLYSSFSVKLIVPEGVAVTHDDLGSNELLMADGEKRGGTGPAVLYKDTKEELERRGYKFDSVLEINNGHAVAAMRMAELPPAPMVLDPEVRAAMRVLNKPSAPRF